MNPYIKRAIARIKTPNSKITPAAKKLRDWLIEKEMTVDAFSRRVGFNKSTLWNYVTSVPNTYPTLAQAFAIEYETKGFIMAWEWLDNPYIQNRVRCGQMAGAKDFETSVKNFVLKYKVLTSPEGMIRAKARILSRMFKVDWGELKKRTWHDARAKAKLEKADISHLMTADITEEEHRANDYED